MKRKRPLSITVVRTILERMRFWRLRVQCSRARHVLYPERVRFWQVRVQLYLGTGLRKSLIYGW